MDGPTQEEILSLFEDSPAIRKKLAEQQVDAAVFREITLGVLEAIGLTKLQAHTVIQRRDELFKQRKYRGQLMRVFGQDPASQGEEINYKKGNYAPKREDGTSSNSGITLEYKQLECPSEELKVPFQRRVVPFVMGCLNARKKGTIFLGITDDGEIVGVPLPSSGTDLPQKFMEESLLGPDPNALTGQHPVEVARAVRDCVKTPILIPVKDGVAPKDDDGDKRYVIEIDVEPKTRSCKELVFGTTVIKKANKAKGAHFYMRIGTSTKEILFESIGAEVKAAATRLRNEEERPRQTGNRLTKLICRGHQKIRDADVNYVLAVDKLGSYEHFDWVPNINWLFVLDFNYGDNPETGDQGLFTKLKDLFTQHPKALSWREMKKELSVDSQQQRRNNLDYRHRVLWLGCGTDSAASDNSPEHISTVISSTFDTLINEEAISNPEKVVFVCLVESTALQKQWALLLSRVLGTITWEHVVIVTTNETTKEELGEAVQHSLSRDKYEKQCVLYNWDQLSTFMDDKIDQVKKSGLKIPCSTGTPVEINNDSLNKFSRSGLEILGCNHGEALASEKTNVANNVILDYFKGNAPCWDLFYCSFEMQRKGLLPGAVTRDAVSDIIQEVTDISEEAVGRGVVKLKRIVHEPGSGASTIAMHVLWQLKTKWRCAKFNENEMDIDSLATCIMSFRAHNEFDETARGTTAAVVCPVLIFFDNAQEDMIGKLKQKLDHAFQSKQILSRQVEIVIMYNVRRLDIAGFAGMHDTIIKQELSESENEKFKNQLRELERLDPEEHKVNTILAFVIMANNFDKNSNYVEKLVEEALDRARDSTPQYQQEAKLLLYLSLLAVYSSSKRRPSLPVKQCSGIIARPSKADCTTFIKRLRPEARLFLIQYQDDINDRLSLNVRVVHVIVAHYLYRKLSVDKLLSDVTFDMLKEKAIVKEPFQRPSVHKTLRIFLVQREQRADEISNNKDRKDFSNIVTEIRKKEGLPRTVELLAFAHDVLANEQKDFLAQALARLFKKHQQLEEALFWAKKAVDHAEHSNTRNLFTCYDTVGQVYKAMVNKVAEEFKRSDAKIMLLKDSIRKAVEANKYFGSARQKFSASWSFDQLDANNYSYFLAEKLTGDSNALLGIVDTNLTILDMILALPTFKEKRSELLFLVRKGATTLETMRKFMDKMPDFEEVASVWKANSDYLSKIYSDSKDCLAHGVRRMHFTRQMMSMVEESTKGFEKIFMENVIEVTWRKVADNSRLSPVEKVHHLQQYLLPVVIHDFVWFTRRDISTLRNFQNIMLTVEQLHEDFQDSKICYITIYFGLINNKDADDPILKRDRVEEISTELIDSTDAKNLHPEFCLFFVLFNWPSKQRHLSGDKEKRFHSCLKLLQDYHSHCLKYETSDVEPLFRVNFREDGSTDIRTARGGWKGHRFEGRQGRFGLITLTPKVSSKSITVKSERQRRRRHSEVHENVTFYLNFTQFGPVAFDVETVK